MNKRLICFDLDGTIIDSRLDVARSHQEAIASVGGTPPPLEDLFGLIGLSLEETYAQVLPVSLHPRIDEAAQRYKAYYFDHCHQHTATFPGVEAGLSRLRKAGFLLAIATTKRTFMAHRVLDLLGLTAAFHHVQGTDDFPHKPCPDIIHACCGALGMDPAHLHPDRDWMVGDTQRDILTGHNAGMGSVAVLYGYGSAASLAEVEPTLMVKDFPTLVEEIMAWKR